MGNYSAIFSIAQFLPFALGLGLTWIGSKKQNRSIRLLGITLCVLSLASILLSPLPDLMNDPFAD